MSNINNASEILTPLINEGVTDPDALMTALADARIPGLSIKAIPSLVNAVLESAGLRISPAARKTAIGEYLAGGIEVSDWEGVRRVADGIVSEIGSGITVAQAISGIKAYAKANDLELPAQTSPSASGASRSNQFDRFRVHYQANPTMTDAEIAEYALVTITKAGEPNPKQAAKYEAIFLAAANLARHFQ
jgi:hypothetical protein